MKAASGAKWWYMVSPRNTQLVRLIAHPLDVVCAYQLDRCAFSNMRKLDHIVQGIAWAITVSIYVANLAALIDLHVVVHDLFLPVQFIRLKAGHSLLICRLCPAYPCG